MFGGCLNHFLIEVLIGGFCGAGSELGVVRSDACSEYE